MLSATACVNGSKSGTGGGRWHWTSFYFILLLESKLLTQIFKRKLFFCWFNCRNINKWLQITSSRFSLKASHFILGSHFINKRVDVCVSNDFTACVDFSYAWLCFGDMENVTHEKTKTKTTKNSQRKWRHNSKQHTFLFIRCFFFACWKRLGNKKSLNINIVKIKKIIVFRHLLLIIMDKSSWK